MEILQSLGKLVSMWAAIRTSVRTHGEWGNQEKQPKNTIDDSAGETKLFVLREKQTHRERITI